MTAAAVIFFVCVYLLSKRQIQIILSAARAESIVLVESAARAALALARTRELGPLELVELLVWGEPVVLVEQLAWLELEASPFLNHQHFLHIPLTNHRNSVLPAGKNDHKIFRWE